MVFDRDVTLDCGKTDRYRRRVCVVSVDDKDANLAQIAAGMAWLYRKYQGEQTARQRADYAAAEEVARAAGRGLWADKGVVVPWEWRHKKANKLLVFPGPGAWWQRKANKVGFPGRWAWVRRRR
jgi:endonuclease YncB( thermonuclease family)